jgi:crotonobetainyl-CoA:carnitine CoA-transferase CaiB-like acyl-CoA transferase
MNLKGIKVLELANVLAGPAVGMFFAELGATVTKVENKRTGGDLTRKWKTPNEPAKNSVSAYYCSVNWGKKVIFLDLTNNVDKHKLYKLVETTDIIITNYKKGDDKKLGTDYKTFKKINQGVIYANISGFPDGKRTAYDVVLQAETGYMTMNGTEQSGPVKMPVALIDILAAHQLKEGILLAMLKKQKTGKGSLVNVSLYETAICSLANQASNYLMNGILPKRIGSLHPNIAPYGEIFTTKDKQQIVLAIGTDKQFAKLCSILKIPDIANSSLYISNVKRVKNRKSLAKILCEPIAQTNSSALLSLLIKHSIPAGKIKNVDEVLNQSIIRKKILRETIESTSTSRLSTISFTFD